MAGIGVKLNRIYSKNTITTDIYGFFYRTVVTIAPVLVVIINLMLMQSVLSSIQSVTLTVNCFPVQCCMYSSSLC